MSKFLDHHGLGLAIANLMAGGQPRCAVAFWGTGASVLFRDPRMHGSARIICDVTMGGSNPQELRRRGAPSNEKLRHLPGLHAKVYLSAQGLITSSANASDNGIGFLQEARLIEAGTFHPPDSDAYQDASLWFETIWNRAGIVDVDALERAEAAWERLPGTRALITNPANPASLFDAVLSNPLRFRGVGFAFTTGQADKDERDAAAAHEIEQDELRNSPILTSTDKKKLFNWRIGNVFSGWQPQDISAWPQRFVCAHRPREKLTYWFYERTYAIVDQGVVLATPFSRLKRKLALTHSTKAMQDADSARAKIIFEHIRDSEHRLYESGEKLAQLLDELTRSRRFDKVKDQP